MSSPASERRRVVYTGRVQGVGFRYTACRLAQGHAVTGFVRNLRDGNVELVVEGSTAEVNGLLNDITAAMSGYIQETRTTHEQPSGQFTVFEIVQ